MHKFVVWHFQSCIISFLNFDFVVYKKWLIPTIYHTYFRPLLNNYWCHKVQYHVKLRCSKSSLVCQLPMLNKLIEENNRPIDNDYGDLKFLIVFGRSLLVWDNNYPIDNNYLWNDILKLLIVLWRSLSLNYLTCTWMEFNYLF